MAIIIFFLYSFLISISSLAHSQSNLSTIVIMKGTMIEEGTISYPASDLREEKHFGVGADIAAVKNVREALARSSWALRYMSRLKAVLSGFLFFSQQL